MKDHLANFEQTKDFEVDNTVGLWADEGGWLLSASAAGAHSGSKSMKVEGGSNFNTFFRLKTHWKSLGTGAVIPIEARDQVLFSGWICNVDLPAFEPWAVVEVYQFYNQPGQSLLYEFGSYTEPLVVQPDGVWRQFVPRNLNTHFAPWDRASGELSAILRIQPRVSFEAVPRGPYCLIDDISFVDEHAPDPPTSTGAQGWVVGGAPL